MAKLPKIKCPDEKCEGFVMVRYLDPISMDDKQYSLVCSKKNCEGRIRDILGRLK